MAIQAFTVLSEFKFDVAGAVLGSEQLQKSIEGISSQAQEAINTVSAMGISFVSNLSGAQAGLIGLFTNAIKSSDYFKASQIEVGNAMLANGMTMNGEIVNFNQALEKSGSLIEGIIKKSREFGVDPNEFVSQTKFYTNLLAPKGLAGDDLSNSTELARVSMKAAPALGVSSDQATSGIMAGISGDLSAATQFGTRLFMEAGDAINKATGIKDLKSFNAAKPELRIRALIAGLDKLAGTSDTVAARANTFANRLNTIKNLFIGIGSIFKPLGDVLIPFINKVLDMAIKWISTKGAVLVKAMSNFLKPLLEDPVKLFMNVNQAAKLSADVKKSAGIVAFVISLVHLKDMLHTLKGLPYIGGIAGTIDNIFSSLLRFPVLGKLITGAMDMFKTGPAVGFVGFLKVIGITIVRMAGLFAVLLIPLQGLSRALMRMKLEALEWFGNNMASLTDTFSMLRHGLEMIFIPIQDLIIGFEELFFFILGGTYALDSAKGSFELFTSVIRFFGEAILFVWSVLRGFVASFIDIFFNLFQNIALIIKNLLSGNFDAIMSGQVNILPSAETAFADEFNKSMMRSMAPNTGEGGVDNNKVSNNIHNYDVKMQNNFKEVLQPDRIAYTIVDQLKKASTNRTGSRNASGTAGRLAEAT